MKKSATMPATSRNSGDFALFFRSCRLQQIGQQRVVGNAARVEHPVE
jgi:hypothetical protein